MGNLDFQIFSEIRKKKYISFTDFSQILDKHLFIPIFKNLHSQRNEYDPKAITKLIETSLSITDRNSDNVIYDVDDSKIRDISEKTGLTITQLEHYFKFLRINVDFVSTKILYNQPSPNKRMGVIYLVLVILFSLTSITALITYTSSLPITKSFLQELLYVLLLMNTVVIIFIWMLIFISIVWNSFYYTYWYLIKSRSPPIQFSGFLDNSLEAQRIRKRHFRSFLLILFSIFYFVIPFGAVIRTFFGLTASIIFLFSIVGFPFTFFIWNLRRKNNKE